MLFTRKQVQYDYDKNNDVLYCRFGDKSNSYGDENPDGIVVMRDMDSNDVTGVTIFHAVKMLSGKDERLLSLEKIIALDTLKQIYENILIR